MLQTPYESVLQFYGGRCESAINYANKFHESN